MGSMTENIADKAINDTRIVKQFTNPVKEPIDSDINLFDLLDNRAKRDPEGAMIEYKGDDGTWHPYSAQVFRDMVIDLAKGLVGLGVNKGDSVAIVSRTRWEWTALDMAIMSIGALTVPVFVSAASADGIAAASSSTADISAAARRRKRRFFGKSFPPLGRDLKCYNL